jgi:hypothetical protein
MGNLVGINPGNGLQPYSILPIVNISTWLAFAAGILLAGPILPNLLRKLGRADSSRMPVWLGDAALAGLLIVSITVIAGSTYQPYIYGNF